MSAGDLPAATEQDPACGCCQGDTNFDGDHFVCDDCQLMFDPDNLSASFLDNSAEVCGDTCDNSWHRDNAIWPGKGHHCGTCQLPTSHTGFHWRNCQIIDLEKG